MKVVTLEEWVGISSIFWETGLSQTFCVCYSEKRNNSTVKTGGNSALWGKSIKNSTLTSWNNRRNLWAPVTQTSRDRMSVKVSWRSQQGSQSIFLKTLLMYHFFSQADSLVIILYWVYWAFSMIGHCYEHLVFSNSFNTLINPVWHVLWFHFPYEGHVVVLPYISGLRTRAHTKQQSKTHL